MLKTILEAFEEPEVKVDEMEITSTDDAPQTEEETDSAFLTSTVNGCVNELWSLISTLKMLIENASRANVSEEVLKILDDVVTDTTINIGMLYKVLQLIDPQLIELINQGKEKADVSSKAETIENIEQ